MLFKYLDRCRFVAGFYKGRLGRIVKYDVAKGMLTVRVRSGLLLGRYHVHVPVEEVKKGWLPWRG